MADSNRVREIAYQRWKDAGEPEGESLRFWLEAESEASEQQREDAELDEVLKESFPASDAPAGSISTVGPRPKSPPKRSGK